MYKKMMLPVVLSISLFGCASSDSKPEKKNTETAMLNTAPKKIHQEANLKILSSYIKPDAKILDLGNGSGIGPRQLCQNGYANVVGLELNQELIKAAEEVKNSETCRTEYVEGDICKKTSFQDGQFDLVTAFSAYHRFSSPECLKEVSRILKPGGYYFITRGMLKNSDPVRVKATQIIEELAGKKVVDPTIDPEKELKAQGFNIALSTTIPVVEYFNKQEYLNYLKTFPVWELAKNSPKLNEIQAKLEQYLNSLANADGVITIEIKAPVILAQKQK